MSIRVTNGFISRVRAGPVEQSFARDRLDRLTNLVWRVQDTPVLEIRNTLDLLGRVTQRVDRSGGAVLAVRDYGYDGLDRLASEAHSSGYAATYAYDDAGRRTAKETARFGVAYTAGTGDRLAGWEVTRTNTWTFQVSGFSSEAPATNPVWCKYSNALLRQWILGIVEMIRAKTTHPKFADFAMWPQQKE